MILNKRQGSRWPPPNSRTSRRDAGTKFILALFVDLRGKPCAKLVPVEAVDLLATEGVGFAGYAVGAMGQEPKDPDLMAIPDPASFTPIPFIKDGPGDRALRPARRGQAVAVRAARHPQVADRSGPPTPASSRGSAPRSSTSC